MQYRMRLVSIILIISLLSSCSTQPDDEATYEGAFNPYARPDIISVINNRLVKPVGCQLSNRTSEQWEAANFTPSDDYRKYFAKRAVLRSASDNTWAVLELDPRIIEAALQIAVSENRLEAAQLPILRVKAQKQLFKKGTRTFVLMHNAPQLWALSGTEPTLISQRSGSGRLVGMSVGIGVGMKHGDMGMLMFEDKVCEEDASYAIRIHFHRADSVEQLTSWAWDETGQYVFGGESNLLGVLGSVYKLYLPEQPQPQSYSVGNIYVSPQDMLALGSFALDLIAFLLKVL
jgi:hypothetical protein